MWEEKDKKKNRPLHTEHMENISDTIKENINLKAILGIFQAELSHSIRCSVRLIL